MSSEAVIEAKNVSKVYLLYNRSEDRLKQMLVPKVKSVLAPFLGGLMPRLRQDQPRFREFWALRDVSIRLMPGETLGIIGQNGSGKSTLLQIICGTLSPSAGVAYSRGKRIAALLELGAGFNPDFTGRENVFLNAAIYGLSRAEIDQRMEEIIEFAEIGEHIDQPVKTYSSGMFVRLAFSVIANVDADVLIIDEALAVGDAYFQQKCMRFLRKFQERGSIFFVSHDTGAMMSFCDRVVWLHHGSIKAQGDPKQVCEEYLAFLYQKHTGVDPDAPAGEALVAAEKSRTDGAGRAEEKTVFTEWSAANLPPPANSRGFGDMAAEIDGCQLFDDAGRSLQVATGWEVSQLVFTFKANSDVSSVIAGFIVKDRLGQYIFGANTYIENASSPLYLKAGDVGEARFKFVMPVLAPGTYSILLSIASGTLEEHVQHHWIHEAIIFHSQSSISTGVLLEIPVESALKAATTQN